MKSFVWLNKHLRKHITFMICIRSAKFSPKVSTYTKIITTTPNQRLRKSYKPFSSVVQDDLRPEADGPSCERRPTQQLVYNVRRSRMPPWFVPHFEYPDLKISKHNLLNLQEQFQKAISHSLALGLLP